MAQGERLGRYTLIEQIAIGGMAEIWLARMGGLEGFEKLVVIKRIKDHLTKEPSFVQMFLNEARLAAQLNHPHIVQIYDLGKIESSYFIAMEYIFGRDLSEITPKAERKEITFPIEYAIKIMIQVCEGLYYAHQKTDPLGEPLDIIHRDISPQNIFVSFDGNIKILDFGIAKAANQYEKTQEGTLKGKLSYMSPEQILGHPYDARSDLFGLGVVFYELVSGYKLFTADNELAVLKSIVEGPVYPPSYFNDNIPEELDQIILKALSKDPDERFQNAWEMQQELNQLMSQFDFNPSNLHLSNFLKQLFADEIEREARYLKQRIGEVLKQTKEQTEQQQAVSGLFSNDSLDILLEEAISIDNLASSNTHPPLNEPLTEELPQLPPPRKTQESEDTQPDLDAIETEIPPNIDDDEPELNPFPRQPTTPSSSHTPSSHQWLRAQTHDKQKQLPSQPLSPNDFASPHDDDPLQLFADLDLDSHTEHFDTHDSPIQEIDPTLLLTEDSHPPQSTPPDPHDEKNEDPLLDVSQILFTMRFRMQEYKQLKQIAERRSVPLDQLLRKLIQHALPHFENDLDLK